MSTLNITVIVISFMYLENYLLYLKSGGKNGWLTRHGGSMSIISQPSNPRQED